MSPRPPLRIALVSSGRFHLCDLARELDALGHAVRFYSLVPRRRTRRFGLPDRCNACLWPLVPLLVLTRLVRRPSWRETLDRLLTALVDRLASWTLRRCDVVIGMSGLCVRTAERARRRYGAAVWIERGSMHVLTQQAVLAGTAAAVPPWAVRRELASYRLADILVVPSQHAAASFAAYGVAPERVVLNPYGVDLSAFPPTPAPAATPPVILCVGRWSHRKGSDVLAAAVARLDGVRLLHVGPVDELPLPMAAWFEHRAAVPQWQLPAVYAAADVFALASREEGLALVQAQALASGLPLVCTDRTGGADLARLLGPAAPVTVVAHGSVAAFAAALQSALGRLPPAGAVRGLRPDQREALSWRAYGARYAAALAARVPTPS